MAVRPGLIALLALAVLLLHTVAIDWLAAAWQPLVLKPQPKPMYTRQIRPEAPPAPEKASKVPGALVQPSRPAITSIAKEAAPAKPKKSAPKPEPAASSAQAAVEPATRPQPDPAIERAAAPADDAAPEPARDAASAPVAPNAPDFAVGPEPAQAGATASDLAIAAPTASAPPATVAAPSASDSAAAAPTSGDPHPDWPTDTRLTYELGGYYRGELHGSAQVLWQRNGSDYEALIEIDLGLLANLKLTSQGRITPEGLAPRAYEELQRTRRLSVRLEDSVVVLGDGKRVDRPPGVQDTASQFVELAHRFATGQLPLEAGRTISLMLARPGGVDSWTYDVVGKVMLPTPTLGAVEAYHLKPRPLVKPGGTISAEIWFAPTLQYLPVRIRVSMKNDEAWVDLIVKRIDQR